MPTPDPADQRTVTGATQAKFWKSPISGNASRAWWWFALGIIALSGGLMVLALHHLRTQALEDGFRLTASLGQVIEEQTSRTLQTVDQQLQLAAVSLLQLKKEGALNERSAHTKLRQQLEGLPFLRAIWVLDDSGRIVYDSDVGNIGVDLSDRAYFQICLQQPQTGFYLGVPVRSRTTGTWLISAARSVQGLGGKSQGVIVAAVEPHYFQQLWSSVSLGDGGSIALFRRDATLMMRSPLDEASLGKQFADAPVFSRLLSIASSGTYENTSVIDARKRIFAYRALSNRPDMVVIVGQARDEVLKPWSRLATVAVSVWSVAAICIALLTAFLQRSWRENMRAEKRIDEIAQRFSLATDAALIGVWDWDASHAEQWYATPTYFSMMGYDPHEGFGNRPQWLSRLHPEDRRSVLDTIDAVLAGQDIPYVYEARMLHGDGTYRWVAVTGKVITRDRDGKPVRMMGVRTDISQRKRAEQELQNYRQHLEELVAERTRELEAAVRFNQNITDAVPGIMAYWDASMVCRFANRGYLEWFGLVRTQVLNRTIAEIFGDGYLASVRAPMDAALQGEAQQFDRTTGRDGDAQFVHQIHYIPDRGPTGGIHGVFVLAFDITAIKRAENRLQIANEDLTKALERLEQAKDQLVQSEKLAALGALVAGVAHELNTPIGNSVTMASSLEHLVAKFRESLDRGLRRSDLDGFVSDTSLAAEVLMRNLERAAGLVSSFKQVAVDRTSSQRRLFLLDTLVSEILVSLSPAMRKAKCKVDSSVDGDLRFDSYPGPLGQVLTNLIDNAMVHAFDEDVPGRISITARAQDSGDVCIEVSDSGRGIPGELQKRVFDPFFTTRLGQGGSGLGLHIAHNIVTGILGGNISLYSEPGVGSKFMLTIPTTAPVQNETE